MKRWHSERDLMVRRWRQEIASHENWSGGPEYSYCALAPVPPIDPQPTGNGELCHCYRGPGFMRKRRAFGGCSCFWCHCEKHIYRMQRSNIRRKAIEFELNSY